MIVLRLNAKKKKSQCAKYNCSELPTVLNKVFKTKVIVTAIKYLKVVG